MVKYPEDWKVVPFGEVWDRFSTGPFGSALHASDYIVGGTPIVNPMHIEAGRIVPEAETTVSDSTVQRLSGYKLSVGDLVMGRRGEMGRVAVVSSKETGWLCGTGCFFIKLKPFVDPEYISLHLRTSESVKAFEGEAVGTTIPNLNQSVAGRVNVALPPLPEQKRIAAVLGNVDKLIDNLSRRIEKKRLVKQGVMQDLLSVGPAALTQRAQSSQRNAKTLRSSVDSAFFASAPAGNLVPRRRLPGFSGEWKRVKIGNLLTLGHGRDYKGLPEGDVPVYGTGGVMCKVDGYLYDGPTVCIGRKGTIDEPIYHEGKIWTVDTLFYTHSFKDAFPRFVYYKFLLVDWLGYNSASGVPSLTSNTIEAIELLMPPTLAEQKAIAGVLGAMDGEIAKLEAKLEKYRSLKQGLMNDLLTGRVRLVVG